MLRNSSTIALPTIWGDFVVSSLQDRQGTHLLLQHGNLYPEDAVLVRIHSCCCFGDVFGGLSCDCRAQLEESIRLIVKAGSGLVFYLNQEGRGLGLAAKVEAIRIEQKENIDTVDAFTRLHFPLDKRCYDMVGLSLKSMGISRIRLLTNNPAKCNALNSQKIEVIRTPLITEPTAHSISYLKAKIERMGHLWSHTLELPALHPSEKLKQSGDGTKQTMQD